MQSGSVQVEKSVELRLGCCLRGEEERKERQEAFLTFLLSRNPSAKNRFNLAQAQPAA